MVWTAAIAVPLIGLALLVAEPSLDFEWEHHPAHFWLVLVAAAMNVVLGVVTSDAARRRADARLFLVSLTFIASAGFLALHALATPGVLLDTPNAGFVVATPVGLLLAGAFAAASSFELSTERSVAFMRRSRLVRDALLAAMVVWLAVSLAAIPPLDDPLPAEKAEGWLLAFAVPGIALYGAAAARYWLLYRRRRSAVVLGVLTAFALLAEAMLAIALARNWHASWWEWHVLMLAAFGLVAVSARREWEEERWSDLYLEQTYGDEKEISVVFADLEGYSSYTERQGDEAAANVANAYFSAIVPLVRSNEGEAHKLIGDALMATFNLRGDQPDHAVRAARAALAIQRAATELERVHPDWPRLRVSVNSGPARVGVVGTAGKREYTALGDAVNLASRLEGKTLPGRVIAGGETYRALPDGTQAESLGGVQVKGKEAPADVYLILDVPRER